MTQNAPSNAGLSVVVIPLVGGEALRACVAALRSQQVQDIAVVGARETHIDGARLVGVEPGSTVPQRRLSGLTATTLPHVAFLEDTCIPAPTWARGMLGAFADPEVAAAGGPVTVDSHLPARARALGLCEYASFGVGRSPSNTFAGANFALRRSACTASMADDFVDNRLVAVLRSAGKIAFRPDACVTYASAPRSQTSLSARYHHGRIYGGNFSARHAFVSRVAAAFIALGAPLVLMARSLAFAAPALIASPATLMWTFLMHCSWGWGEIVGKLTGSTGDSLEKWA